MSGKPDEQNMKAYAMKGLNKTGWIEKDRPVFAVGSRPNCVEIACDYGATDIINYRQGDIVEQVLALTSGRGVD